MRLKRVGAAESLVALSMRQSVSPVLSTTGADRRNWIVSL